MRIGGVGFIRMADGVSYWPSKIKVEQESFPISSSSQLSTAPIFEFFSLSLSLSKGPISSATIILWRRGVMHDASTATHVSVYDSWLFIYVFLCKLQLNDDMWCRSRTWEPFVIIANWILRESPSICMIIRHSGVLNF